MVGNAHDCHEFLDRWVQEARQDAEAEVVGTAEENGILETAESNAEEGIRAFVTTLSFDEVEFVAFLGLRLMLPSP